MIKEIIQKLIEKRDLIDSEAYNVMDKIISGDATEAQIAAFLIALKMKGETVDEIKAFAKAMKARCIRITPNISSRLVDLAGTGGDKVKAFNISTIAAFVAAGAGISVAKHCNKAVTGRSGSADLLEKLGFNLDLEPKVVEESISKIGIGFMFAPKFHPAMKYASSTRKEIGVRTVFNILGPLTNPANVDAQLVGVYDLALVKQLALALKSLECDEAMVVHGLEGLDEISATSKTVIAWLKEEEVRMLETTPETFGFEPVNSEYIQIYDSKESAIVAFNLLNGYDKGNNTNAVLANAAAAIIVGGKAEEFGYAVDLARSSIDSGSAYMKLKELIRMTGGDSSRLEELETKNV